MSRFRRAAADAVEAVIVDADVVEEEMVGYSINFFAGCFLRDI